MASFKDVPNAVFSSILLPFFILKDVLELSQISKDFSQITNSSIQKAKEEEGLRIITDFHQKSGYTTSFSLTNYFIIKGTVLCVKKLFQFFIPQLFDYIYLNNIEELKLEGGSDFLIDLQPQMKNQNKILMVILTLIERNITLKECNIGFFENFDNLYHGNKIWFENMVKQHPTLKVLTLTNPCHAKCSAILPKLVKQYDGSVVWKT